MLISDCLWLRIAQPRDEGGDQTCLVSVPTGRQQGWDRGCPCPPEVPCVVRQAGAWGAGILVMVPLTGQQAGGDDPFSSWNVSLTSASRQDPGIDSHLYYNLSGPNPRGSITPGLV